MIKHQFYRRENRELPKWLSRMKPDPLAKYNTGTILSLWSPYTTSSKPEAGQREPPKRDPYRISVIVTVPTGVR